jgi:hypothetical protein
MPPEKEFSRIYLFLGFAALALLLIFFKPITEYRSFLLQKAGIYRDNFFASGDPKILTRRRPVSCAAQEGELIARIRQPFTGFTNEQWDKFWEIIYGVYPRQEPEGPGLPYRMRQLTYAEIASELIKLYPQPFANFSRQHWNNFFSIILNS